MFNLPIEDRLRLVEDLWESIRENPESLPLPDAQREELGRRIRMHRSDPQAAEGLEVVLERLRSQE